MPKITQQENGGVVRWDGDDWIAGLLPIFDTSGFLTLAGGTGLVNSTGIDPLRRPGYLMPGVEPLVATNASQVDSLAKNGEVYDDDAYIIAGSKLHQLNILTRTITNGATFPYSIGTNLSGHGGHTGFDGEDVLLVYISGTPYLLYSWNDTTDGDIGRYDFSTTFADDYVSASATGGAVLGINPHPMILGSDGTVYIGDGSDIASYRPADNTFNGSALDIPSGFVVTSFATTPNFLVVYAYRSSAVSGGSFYKSESKAFFWDYLSESYTYAYDLPGNYVNGGFNFKSTVGCFLEGDSAYINSDKVGKLVLFNGSNFEPIVNFPNKIPENGGVEVSDNVIYWNSEGQIYQYGSPHIGYPTVLNRISKGKGSSSGMLRNFAKDRLTGSSGTSTSGGMDTFYTGYYDATAYSPIIDLPIPNGFSKIRVTKVRIFWLSEGADVSNRYGVSVGFRYNSGEYIQNVVESTDTVPFAEEADNDTFVQEYIVDSSGNPFYEASSLGIKVVYSIADNTVLPTVVRAIEVFYEYVSI